MRIPQWIAELAEDSDRRLSALPVNYQPNWYRQNITEPRQYQESVRQHAIEDLKARLTTV